MKQFLIIFCILCSLWTHAIATSMNITDELDMYYKQRAQSIVDSLDTKRLIAQTIIVSVRGEVTAAEHVKRLLTNIPVGGVILYSHNFVSDIEKNRAFVSQLVDIISNVTLPPFVVIDHEGGSVQRVRGSARIPAPLSYYERYKSEEIDFDEIIALVESDAARSAEVLRYIGVTLNIAPIVEILTDVNQPFLKTRSYGPDHIFTTNAAVAFIKGMHSAGIAATIKHFPGNSATDPHYYQVVLDKSLDEMDLLIQPFRDVIHAANPAAVMTSTVIVPSWDSISLSRSPVPVRYLREMGFEGIIMSDCFQMASTGESPDRAASQAINAGVDMVLSWPETILRIYNALEKGVENGEIPHEIVRAAVERIVYQKLRFGLIE